MYSGMIFRMMALMCVGGGGTASFSYLTLYVNLSSILSF